MEVPTQPHYQPTQQSCYSRIHNLVRMKYSSPEVVRLFINVMNLIDRGDKEAMAPYLGEAYEQQNIIKPDDAPVFHQVIMVGLPCRRNLRAVCNGWPNTMVIQKTQPFTGPEVSQVVEQVTNGFLKIQLTDPVAAAAVLYFKGQFEKKFKKHKTVKKHANLKEDMMRDVRSCGYIRGNNYHSVILPFKGGNKTYLQFIIPLLEGQTMVKEEVEQLLGERDWSHKQKVNLIIPKIDVSAQANVSHLIDQFNWNEDGVLDGIEKFLRFNVDEDGAEAAAAMVAMFNCAMPSAPEQTIPFHVTCEYVVQLVCDGKSIIRGHDHVTVDGMDGPMISPTN